MQNIKNQRSVSMWNSLIILLEDEEEAKKVVLLKEECKKQGIVVKIYFNQNKEYKLLQDGILQQFFIPEEIVLITSDSMTAKKAILQGTAVLGYEKEGEILSGIRYITQSLEVLCFSYIKKVYCRFHSIPMLIQETEHLWIREMEEKDAADFFEMQQENEISHVMENTRRCVEEERSFIKTYCENQYAFYEFGFWAIVEKITGKVIGKIGIEEHEREGKSYLELGYWIKRAERRKGYAYEAGKAVLKFCREELELSGKIYCFVQPENIASLRTAQKLGFLKTEQILNKCYCCVCML